MCVIISCEDKRPSLKLLKAAAKENPDGAGVAWIERGKVKYIKGLDFKTKDIYDLTQTLPLPFVVHFRITSVGETTPGLCHPFIIHKDSPNPLKGTAKSVVFHNGTWTDWKDYVLKTACARLRPVPNGNWSDTRAMAWLASILGVGFLKVVDEKIIVFDKNGPQYIGEDWVEVEGLKCSNDYFVPFGAVVVSGWKKSKVRETIYYSDEFGADKSFKPGKDAHSYL